MNETEWAILNEFLDRLSESMGNAGCNDYTLPDTPEGWAIAAEVAAERDEKPDTIYVTVNDWEVLDVLRKKLAAAFPTSAKKE